MSVESSSGKVHVPVESHGIDFVPIDERYGSPRRLFTIWFSTNLTIVCVEVGALGVLSGLSFMWATVGVIIGNAVGTIFMAAHSAQGPHLGIPQMIQSRAQFGVLGAGIPLVAVVLTYLLYSAADTLVVQGTLSELTSLGSNNALILFAVATLLVAFVGYELIHRIGAVMTIASVIMFACAAYLFVVGKATVNMSLTGQSGQFNGTALSLTITQAAAWSLSFGPYVADYSRYLPETTPDRQTFWYTAAGCFLGSTLMMTFGAYMACIDTRLAENPGEAVANVFGTYKWLAELVIVAGVLLTNVMNVYSAYMSTATIFSGLRLTAKIPATHKLILMALLTAGATLIAGAVQHKFASYFSDMLNAMVYLLVPWSAINLADYYVTRQGRYNIEDMFRIQGEYGAFRWRAIAVYAVGIVAQGPFMSVSFFQGAIARMLGVDVAWIPGLIIPAVLYVFFERGLKTSTAGVASAPPQN
jgi:nucleobase:cation symporter-1, NCS1 family